MKRSDFLAIIPSLSALPFLGKDIVKKSDRIEIFQPEQVHEAISMKDYCEFQIVKNGRVLATGFIDEVNANRDMIDVTCSDNNGARALTFGNWTCRVTGIVTGPVTREAFNAMHEINSLQLRHNTNQLLNKQ